MKVTLNTRCKDKQRNAEAIKRFREIRKEIERIPFAELREHYWDSHTVDRDCVLIYFNEEYIDGVYVNNVNGRSKVNREDVIAGFDAAWGTWTECVTIDN